MSFLYAGGYFYIARKCKFLSYCSKMCIRDRAKDGGEAIPPVVARIFSGDSTSPLTSEARVLAVFVG